MHIENLNDTAFLPLTGNDMKYIVPNRISLLEALVFLFPACSKNTLKSWVKEGRVLIDDTPAKNTSVIVAEGQEITIGDKKKILRSGLPIIYEDEDLLIVDKPSGLLSVATAFEKGETVYALLKAHYHPRKIFVVHRLDQDTSGVMVFAFNQTSLDRLKSLFEVHAIERSYTAIVEGQLRVPSGTWESYQFEDKQYVVHETSDPEEGRLAITHFETAGTDKRYSWLRLTLETGRKNQIRVHCEGAGFPVVGDKKYGAKSNPVKRLCLHAHLLAFQHPSTKKKLRFESPVPEEFYRLMPSMKGTT